MHLHFVFAPKYRAAVLDKAWRDDLFKYITGIVQTRGHKMLCINGMPDHVHMLIGFRPTESMADLMQKVKEDSSAWIRTQKLVKGTFRWQEGYGAFSYSKSHVPNVIRYIQQQEKHHAKKTFIDEYVEMLEKFEVDYDPRYIFKPLE